MPLSDLIITPRERRVLERLIDYQMNPLGCRQNLGALADENKDKTAAWHIIRSLEHKSYLTVLRNRDIEINKNCRGEKFSQLTPKSMRDLLERCTFFLNDIKYGKKISKNTLDDLIKELVDIQSTIDNNNFVSMKGQR